MNEKKPVYTKPQVEELDLDKNVTPEMSETGRSGMGSCKHTYL